MTTVIGWFLVAVCSVILLAVALTPLFIPDRCDCCNDELDRGDRS